MARIARKSQKKNRSRSRKQTKKTRRVRRRVMKSKWVGGNKQEDEIFANILTWLRQTKKYQNIDERQIRILKSVITDSYMNHFKKIETIPNLPEKLSEEEKNQPGYEDKLIAYQAALADYNKKVANVYETTNNEDPILENDDVITEKGLMRGDNPTPILTWEQMAQNIYDYIRKRMQDPTYVFTNIPQSSQSVSSNTTSPFGAGSV